MQSQSVDDSPVKVVNLLTVYVQLTTTAQDVASVVQDRKQARQVSHRGWGHAGIHCSSWGVEEQESAICPYYICMEIYLEKDQSCELIIQDYLIFTKC